MERLYRRNGSDNIRLLCYRKMFKINHFLGNIHKFCPWGINYKQVIEINNHLTIMKVCSYDLTPIINQYTYNP